MVSYSLRRILTVNQGLDKFYFLIAAINFPLYLIFLLFILLFQFLPYVRLSEKINRQSPLKCVPFSPQPTLDLEPLQCLDGTLSAWPNRRIASTVYKCFLALVCVAVAALFGWFGRPIYAWLKGVDENKAGPDRSGIYVCILASLPFLDV